MNYKTLFRWGIETGYANASEVNLVKNETHYRHEHLIFIQYPIFAIYVVENKDDEVNKNNFETKALIVYKDDRWIYEGSWEKYIEGYFSSLQKTKERLREERGKELQRENEKKKKRLQEKLDDFNDSIKESNRPTIKLLGRNPEHVNAGFSYFDRGAVAQDIYGNDITDDVEIDDSDVSEKEVGGYEVTYTVIDKDGLKRKITRKVVVE